MNQVEQHEKFKKDLIESNETVDFVEEYYYRHGHFVLKPEMKVAETYEDRAKCADEGFDLIINGQTYNVKHSSHTFSSIDQLANKYSSYPRPILACSAHVKIPDNVLIVSNDRNGGILIPGKYQKHWGIRKNVYDRRYKRYQDCRDVSVDRVEWVDFTK